MIEDPKLPERQPAEESEEEQPKYTPRPKWQIAFAWVLVGIVIAGVIASYLWMMSGI